ncbi:MAG: dihydrolipoamide succinyltransferase [Gammaproteobacteria bacterium]|nr:MAG: dihydrolipoamide succinyltransferase [Gammaproteobacteria bacterium]
MLVEIKVPPLPESVSEGTLMTWHKKPGDQVAVEDPLIDLETDKIVLEVVAVEAGVLKEIRQPDGAVVTAGELLAIIDTEGSGVMAAVTVSDATPEAAGDKGAPALSPAVRKLVADHRLDPQAITGTGKDRRLLKEDVLKYIEGANTTAAATPVADVPTNEQGRQEQRVPMTRIRLRIAERLLQAQQGAAILTTFNEVDMQPVMQLREKYKSLFEQEHDTRLGFMSFFVRASIEALKKFPLVNASIDGNDIVYHGFYDIGVAVSSPRGLVVPIIRDADLMSFADIEKKIRTLGSRAQDNKLSVEDLTGGTFTITNGGIFGSMLSTPILNPPQSAILGMHNIVERPVVVNGEVVIRPIMYLALSYDHRIVDGREAVSFLVSLKEALEDPARMLLQL